MYDIVFAVTNQLVYDQRMLRICNSLQQQGYHIILIGRNYTGSHALPTQQFKQQRIFCWCKKGILMYAEFNTKLFFTLLFTHTKAYCAIDVDTMLPCFAASKLLKRKIVYDAHEWFSQQKEIITRQFVYKCWHGIEKYCIPKIPNGYTVNGFIQQQFKQLYGVDYAIVRNIPTQKKIAQVASWPTPIIIYQGAVNEGRSFETLIPAMKYVAAHLWIVGEGNFLQQAKQLAITHQVTDKVVFKGAIHPTELALLTPQAYIGVTIFEPTGANQIHSLANRFFDYMMAGIPQICVNYPEYEAINSQYGFALMIKDVQTETIATALNNLLTNIVLYTSLKDNALLAREQLHWQKESKQLIDFWLKVLA